MCQPVTNYGAFKKQGLKISKQWLKCSVAFNGNHRQSQLSSLRKVYEHAKGQAHRAAELILRKANENKLEAVVDEQQRLGLTVKID